MADINRPYVKWALIITLFLSSGIAIFANRTLFWNTSTHQIAAAKKKWAAQNITHYLLTLNYSGYNNCQQEVEIKDKTIIAVKQNTCETRPLQTIATLFAEIEYAASGEKCGPNGCACDGPVRIDANYDAKYGYPTQLDFRLKSEQRWQYFDYWKNQFSGGACTLVGFVGNKITVSNFKAIQ